MEWMNAVADARLEVENEMAWRRRIIEERIAELKKTGPVLTAAIHAPSERVGLESAA